jgi:hypothetical protein
MSRRSGSKSCVTMPITRGSSRAQIGLAGGMFPVACG